MCSGGRRSRQCQLVPQGPYDFHPPRGPRTCGMPLCAAPSTTMPHTCTTRSVATSIAHRYSQSSWCLRTCRRSSEFVRTQQRCLASPMAMGVVPICVGRRRGWRHAPCLGSLQGVSFVPFLWKSLRGKAARIPTRGSLGSSPEIGSQASDSDEHRCHRRAVFPRKLVSGLPAWLGNPQIGFSTALAPVAPILIQLSGLRTAPESLPSDTSTPGRGHRGPPRVAAGRSAPTGRECARARRSPRGPGGVPRGGVQHHVCECV